MLSLALYVHVPFCGQRCAYCHFDIKVLHPRSNPADFHARYLSALRQECRFYADSLGARPLHSVFLGGGTPSRLSLSVLGEVTEAVRRSFSLTDDCEWSMEVNPEDGSEDYLKGLASLGFTRLSFGVQTFDDRALQALKRPHNAQVARTALETCAALNLPHGFSFDLMLGLPYQDEAALSADLAMMRSLQPNHLSVYMLETDLPTSLDKTGRGLPMPTEDQQADWYERVVSECGAYGLEHYEISNFAQPGFRCRHNLTYWHRRDYVALGPAAHGYVAGRYWANQARFDDWCRTVADKGCGVFFEERHDEARQHSEGLIQAMRLMEGVPYDRFSERQQRGLSSLAAAGLLHRRENRLALTVKGCLLANEVFAVLLET